MGAHISTLAHAKGLCAPLFVRMLSNLQALLDTAETDVTARGYKAHALLRSRLVPDMLRLLNRFQLASASAR